MPKYLEMLIQGELYDVTGKNHESANMRRLLDWTEREIALLQTENLLDQLQNPSDHKMH